MFKLVEPSEEMYALCVNRYNFPLFDLLYTDAGYKAIDGEPIKNFEDHYGYFIVDKKDKDIGHMATTAFTKFFGKEYSFSDLIKKVERED